MASSCLGGPDIWTTVAWSSKLDRLSLGERIVETSGVSEREESRLGVVRVRGVGDVLARAVPEALDCEVTEDVEEAEREWAPGLVVWDPRAGLVAGSDCRTDTPARVVGDDALSKGFGTGEGELARPLVDPEAKVRGAVGEPVIPLSARMVGLDARTDVPGAPFKFCIERRDVAIVVAAVVVGVVVAGGALP